MKKFASYPIKTIFTALVLCITLFSLQGQSLETTSSLSEDSAKLATNSNSLLANGFQKVKIPLIKKGNDKRFWVLPGIAWNNYDKTQLGLLFGIQKKDAYDILIAPLYGTGSGNLTGFLNASYKFKTPRIKQWEIGVDARRFSYLLFPEDLCYNVIKPSLHFTPAAAIMGNVRLGIQSTYVWQEFLLNGRQTQAFNFHNLDLDYFLQEKKFSLASNLDLQFNKNFGLAKWANSLELPISTHPGNSSKISSFIGSFIFNNRPSNNINPPLPVFQLSGLSNTGIYWLQKDYGFEDWYVDRNAQDDFLRKQVANSEGGFLSPTSVGNTNNFMAAINIESDVLIPARVKRWLNFKVFANGAVVKNKAIKADIYGELGASIYLMNEVIGFHLPFISTSNIRQNQQSIFNIGPKDWTQRISFSIDIRRIKELAKD